SVPWRPLGPCPGVPPACLHFPPASDAPRMSALDGEESPRLLEFIAPGAWVADEQAAAIHDDLARGIELDVTAVHRSGRRAFKVDPFHGVTAAVARALELVLPGLPVGRAAKMRAPRINHEEFVRLLHDPDAVLFLKLGLHTQRKVRGITHGKNRLGLK